MLELRPPDAGLAESWFAAVAEFDGAHLAGSGFDGAPPEFGAAEFGAAEFEAMVADRLGQADPATTMPPGRVHCTFLWIVEDETFLGFLAIRHELTPFLLEQGGHIGYAVRPSRRGQGIASWALEQSLPTAAELGIDPVLVTCDADNEASRRTILRCGGRYEDTRAGKERYWIPTGRNR